ncbi:M20 aminoacylase family protein [Phreatobacter oligotrophus]|uniref:Hippurate hydrolase n=1 Tax=Phreatobacter oligotrophus TaxID=1122261 RepID=A0A2T4YY25_9HYPH|nr:M20 aminoacylase family protein [Phreatobacter oligotrophus]PTM51412.1 hippurate hydrolase [Phreatobacter oligotrophus]
MPIINRVADLHDEITAWRRDFHENPELLYDVHRTAGIVEQKLKEFGCDEVVSGIGQTGVVAVIKGRKTASGKVVGVRADMDALPIEEATNLPYKSKVPGKMHACGHDGHTAMLLGAAKYLAETRNFDGTAIMIFQPAEEGGGGGDAMVKDGLMTRWGIQEVYGLHNMPGIPVGHFAVRKGPAMAAADRFIIDIEGKGGHGAMPHLCVDPVQAGFAIGLAMQTIVSRNVDPIESAVISITSVKAGEAFNVIPQTLRMLGTVRTFKPEIQDLVEARMKELVENVAKGMGCVGTINYQRGYPVTFNHSDQTDFAVKVAQSVVGADKVDPETPPLMGAEDFSYMLNERPGCYIFLGNGDTAACHHPAYNFDDNAIPTGTSYLAKIVETAMPA